MKKILLTGASSFIGQKLIDRLIEGGYDIIALVRPGNLENFQADENAHIEIFELDMENYKNLSEIVSGEIDILIHLAWNGTRGEERNNEVLQNNNFVYSMDLVHQCIKLNCRKIISAGSQAEYGLHDGEISEATVCKPNTEYGAAKLKFYQQTKKVCDEKNLSFIEPRFFSLYGPNDFEQTMIISILKKMLRNEECELTLGIQMWDFLHIDDAVNGLITLVNSDTAMDVYNFGSGDKRQLKEFILQMKKLSNSKSYLNFGAVEYPVTGIISIVPDIKKLKNTGWTPKIKFEDGIIDLINILKKKIV